MSNRYAIPPDSLRRLTCVRRPLPDALTRRLEALFRADLSDVCAYELEGEPLPGVHALAAGPNLFFSPGRLAPGSAAGVELIAHEIAHVLQQRAGATPVDEPGAHLLCDPQMEAQACRMGARAAAWVIRDDGYGPSAAHASADAGRVRFRVGELLSPDAAVFQPYVKMARNRAMPRAEHFTAPNSWTIKDQDYALLTDFPAAEAQVRRIATLQGATTPEIHAALAVLRRWMGLTLNGMVLTAPGEIVRWFGRDAAALARMISGRNAELKYFNNYGELATALLGEVRSEPSAMFEHTLAKAVLRTQWIATQLRSLAERIVRTWDALYEQFHEPPSVFSGLLGYSGGEPWSFRGSYWQYHRYMTPLSGLKAAGSNTIAVNIAVLHDMMEFIKAKAGESHLHRSLEWTNPQNPALTTVIEKRDMRNNLGTVNEAYAVVKAARGMRYRMQAGPSFTVSQMLALADVADASPAEKRALAYAIFAFWDQVYQQACTPIHTYFEVLVAANNYGVPFDAARSYRANAPPPVVVVLNQLLAGTALPLL